MATAKTEATLEDLYAAECDEGKYELVNGELVWMLPPGFEHNRIVVCILLALVAYETETRTGYAATDNLSYVVRTPPRTFNPDVSFTDGLPPITPRFIEGPPRFAVEIRSPGDYGPKQDAAYAEKRAAYFAAGTVVVWDVDPQEHTVRSYSRDQPDAPDVFHEGDEAHAEPALPGWRIAVSAIFAVMKPLP